MVIIMEFHEKLKELRKNKNITQEELASKLYVTRTAVSKWELGKGYPSIETLKEIALFYDISIDELLSKDDLVDYSIKSIRREKRTMLILNFGLLDISMILMLFIPFFGQAQDNIYISVGLFNLSVNSFVFVFYCLLIIFSILVGIVNLIFLALEKEKGANYINIASLLATLVLIVALILTKQPYAGIYVLAIGIIKLLIYIKIKMWE